MSPAVTFFEIVIIAEKLWTTKDTSDVDIIIFPQEFAFERSQKYKEGKFIIETIHMVKDNGWDLMAQ